MTLLNLFSRGSRARACDTPVDRTAALIFYLLLGLVFAPVIGLHVALAASDTGAVTAPVGVTHDSRPATRQHR
jgi:hypothetical protein